jgi:hypothetical protein
VQGSVPRTASPVQPSPSLTVATQCLTLHQTLYT